VLVLGDLDRERFDVSPFTGGRRVQSSTLS
jgi:hypothetical protein